MVTCGMIYLLKKLNCDKTHVSNSSSQLFGPIKGLNRIEQLSKQPEWLSHFKAVAECAKIPFIALAEAGLVCTKAGAGFSGIITKRSLSVVGLSSWAPESFSVWVQAWRVVHALALITEALSVCYIAFCHTQTKSYPQTKRCTLSSKSLEPQQSKLAAAWQEPVTGVQHIRSHQNWWSFARSRLELLHLA